MPFDIGAFGQGEATQAAGAILGIGLGAYNRNQQEIQTRRLQGIQIAGEKEMSDYNMSKQLQMWKDTSYPAQMEQLKKAGLNPGLLYGMGGAGGGVTGQTTSNVTGQQAPSNTGEAVSMAGMGIQAGMMAAQQELMKAEARKANAEAKNEETVNPQKTVAETGLALANTGNAEQDTQLKKVETGLKAIQGKIAAATIEEQIRIISQSATELDEIVMQLGVKTNMDRATQQDKIDTIHAEMIGAFLDNNLKTAMTGKTEQEIQNMKQEILQKWKALSNETRGLDQKDAQLAIEKWGTEMRSAYPSIWGVMGNSLQTLTRTLDNRTPTYQIPMPGTYKQK